MSASDAGNLWQLPVGDTCRCQGDGATWVETSECPVHTLDTSPLAKAMHDQFEQAAAEARTAQARLAPQIVRLRTGALHELGPGLCTRCLKPLDPESGQMFWSVPGKGVYHEHCYHAGEEGK